MLEESGGGFDVIVDDGGHSMRQQQTSLWHLWRALRPGGTYVVEDLQTSVITRYLDAPTTTADRLAEVLRYEMVEQVHLWFPNLQQAVVGPGIVCLIKQPTTQNDGEWGEPSVQNFWT
eukprot:TRINITY_DN1772_c0_g1_i3.p2 TRINITY_DN1772_c0_g1~~TRINITY_DN1772_c0_g1_i3.p2  ORF type:complete len:118 (-),score=36.72 TRINITY_DN1772_c0_g1_i3:83-436(-)